VNTTGKMLTVANTKATAPYYTTKQGVIGDIKITRKNTIFKSITPYTCK
jgi:hypothetical protein